MVTYNLQTSNYYFLPSFRFAPTDFHAHPHPIRALTNLAAGAPSSICADTAPPCVGPGGICRLTGQGVWPAGRPVSPGTRPPPAPRAETLRRQPHTAPNPGTMPCTGGQLSTRDELQHSQLGKEGRGRWLLRMVIHLKEKEQLINQAACLC